MKIIRVIDFETTGFPPRAGVCEVGWTDVIFDAGTATIGETFSLLCKPGLPIGPDAERIHGISDAMVANEPASAMRFRSLMEGPDAFCAHNAEFERAFFAGGEKPWVCTYKVALDRFPGLKSYKNGNLPFELGLDLDPDRCEPLHRAGPDTYVTAMILAHFLRSGISVPQMIEITRAPKCVTRMPFGKHQGTPIADLPVQYMRWAVQNISAPDVRTAIAKALTEKENRQ